MDSQLLSALSDRHLDEVAMVTVREVGDTYWVTYYFVAGQPTDAIYHSRASAEHAAAVMAGCKP